MAQSAKNIVAGPGEATFDERYNLHLKLPVPESEFLRLVKQQGLEYEVVGERGTRKLISPPRLSHSLDVTQIVRQYQIYGDIDRSKRVGKMYWAYVDRNDDVIYVENAFSYTGP